MDENNENSNDLFYGSNAGTSGSDISDADLALLEKSNNQGVVVQDGDDIVEVSTGDEEQEEGNNPEDTPEDKPEDKQKEDQEQKPLEAQIEESQKELDEIGEDLKAKGVDVDALLESFTKTGKFSDADYKALADAGYSKGAVNAIVKGQVALAQEATRALFASVGGEQNFNTLSEFAVANDPDAVEAFNEAQNRGDVRTAQVILKGIERAHKARYGTANKMVSGRPASGAKVQEAQGFATKAEMVKAMSDSRYGRDMKYTSEVERRVGASQW